MENRKLLQSSVSLSQLVLRLTQNTHLLVAAVEMSVRGQDNSESSILGHLTNIQFSRISDFNLCPKRELQLKEWKLDELL